MKLVNTFGCWRMQTRQLAPGLEVGAHVADDAARSVGFSADSCRPASAAHDRHAGLEQGVHLAREQHQVGELDALLAEAHLQQPAGRPPARRPGPR